MFSQKYLTVASISVTCELKIEDTHHWIGSKVKNSILTSNLQNWWFQRIRQSRAFLKNPYAVTSESRYHLEGQSEFPEQSLDEYSCFMVSVSFEPKGKTVDSFILVFCSLWLYDKYINSQSVIKSAVADNPECAYFVPKWVKISWKSAIIMQL